MRRIKVRQISRVIDEREFELNAFDQEFRTLEHAGSDLGEPFDASDPPTLLVARMLSGLRIAL
jgi:hypothetical protein